MLSLRAVSLLLVLAFAASARANDAATARVGDLLPEIEDILTASGAPPGARVDLAAPDTMVAVDAEGDAGLSLASYAPATGRFMLRARGADGRAAYVAGRARLASSTVVASRAIARGAMFEASDLAANDGSGASADLIGKIARRPIASGAAIRPIDVAEPVLVKRGDAVTILVEAPGIRLSRQGIARSGGVAGDRIDVDVGADIGFVRATIVGPKLLETTPGGAPLARKGA